MPDNKNQIEDLSKLVKEYSNKLIKSITKLPQSASYREYYRITFDNNDTIIGVFNEDYKENLAYINFSKTFLKKGFNVPQILAEDLSKNIYLLNDLGATTLFDVLTKERNGSDITKPVLNLYKKSLKQLIDFQLTGNELNYEDCYPRKAFDEQSMFWDLNYFKYYFLKLAKIPFDE